jgi:hypothetical protein
MAGQLSKWENCAVVVHRRYLSPPAWFVGMWPMAPFPGFIEIAASER